MTARLVSGVFGSPEDTLAATRAVRESGYDLVDVYTPFAVHGMEQAMGLRPSRLTWVCFTCGAIGALGMLWVELWTSAFDWPINVGGKPYNSVPAFIPIAFELAILLAGLGVVVALFLRCGLWPGKHAAPQPGDVTDDRFVLVVRLAGGPHSLDDLQVLLQSHNAVAVEDSVEGAR